jgi:hypothetical protein
MALAKLLCVVLAGTQLVEGHSSFVRVALNGEWARPFQYIRNKTDPYIEKPDQNRPENERWYNDPTFPEKDYPESIRCGRDHMAHAAETEVMKVKAGDEIEIVATIQMPTANGFYPPITYWDDCPEGRGICRSDGKEGWFNRVYHPGPVMAHLSKVPEGMDVHEYDGTGEWVKIYTLGASVGKGDHPDRPRLMWPNNNDRSDLPPPRMRLTLPKQTPHGQYLLRLDSVYIGGMITYPGETEESLYRNAQVYGACVHIDVESEASGPLPKGIHIPEDIMTPSPGMHTDARGPSLYEAVDEDYVYPGGPLWDGETLTQDRVPPYL